MGGARVLWEELILRLVALPEISRRSLKVVVGSGKKRNYLPIASGVYIVGSAQ